MSPDDISELTPDGDEQWKKYAYYVLEELKEAKLRDSALERKVDSNTSILIALKERSGWTGFLGGMLPALGIALWEVMKK